MAKKDGKKTEWQKRTEKKQNGKSRTIKKPNGNENRIKILKWQFGPNRVDISIKKSMRG